MSAIKRGGTNDDDPRPFHVASDDLVTRLTGSHDDGCEVFLTMLNHRPTCSCSFLDRVDAAKEIERLRADLAAVEAKLPPPERGETIAMQVQELRAERDALRCPRCDTLRLELGEQRERAERAEAELDAERARHEYTATVMKGEADARDKSDAERDSLRALLAEALAAWEGTGPAIVLDRIRAALREGK